MFAVHVLASGLIVESFRDPFEDTYELEATASVEHAIERMTNAMEKEPPRAAAEEWHFAGAAVERTIHVMKVSSGYVLSCWLPKIGGLRSTRLDTGKRSHSHAATDMEALRELARRFMAP